MFRIQSKKKQYYMGVGLIQVFFLVANFTYEINNMCNKCIDNDMRQVCAKMFSHSHIPTHIHTRVRVYVYVLFIYTTQDIYQLLS